MDIKVDEHTVIVFDLDDTLYNELDFLKSAYKSIAQYLEPTDWKPLYISIFSLYRCGSNVFEFLVEKYKIDIKVLIDMYRNHKPEIQLFDGVINVLNAIKSNKGSIGIITDGRSKTQRAKLESLGVYDYIDEIIISEELGSEKPSVDNFRAIENAISGTQYYYIADNLKKDFVAPNYLGWKSIALLDNGKNIHFEANKYMDNQHQPHGFILAFNDINII